MTVRVRVALDAMGGDQGLVVSVPAAALALAAHPALELLLVGEPAALQASVDAAGLASHPRLQVVAASQVVAMDEEPARALRGKKDSSMRVAINQVRDGAAAACVSAGNTGALMATARFVLKMLPGVDRPAIVSEIPSRQGHTHMLDLGANAECAPEHLLQFAVMGTVLARAVTGKAQPRVGLLNIGSEDIKGTSVIKAAAALLEASELAYIGYVEGSDIFLGDVDVVVCDGFAGNVALKASEGTARLLGEFLRSEYQRGLLSRLAALASRGVLNRFRKRVDPGRYNGASLLGLNGIVIKSHGSADAHSLANAIGIALLEVEKAVPEKIRSEVGRNLVAA